MDFVLSFLPFVALLACPLMMVFCFWGMRRMSCDTPAEKTSATETPAPDERIAQLEHELTAVQAEMASLRAQAATPQAVELIEAEEPVLSGVEEVAQR